MARQVSGATREEGALEALHVELAGIRQTLGLVLEVQATQTEMLRQVLAAAAAPTETETGLADGLAQVQAIFTRQSSHLDGITVALGQLPQAIAQAVREAIQVA